MFRIIVGMALLSLLSGTPAGASLPSDPLADPAYSEILQLENSRDTGARLQELARKGPGPVRARAIRALARAQDPALVTVFADLIRDKDADVRSEAALGMGLLWENGDVASLIEAFSKEKDARVREMLVEAVGRCGTVENGVGFLSGIAAGADTTLAFRACIGLGVLGQRGVDITASLATLNNVARSPAASVRWALAFALFRGLPDKAPPIARLMLKDSDSLVRIFALKAIGASQHRQHQLAVAAAPLVQDPDWRVRVEAVRALALVRAYPFVSTLGLATEDSELMVRLAAIEALGDLRASQGLKFTHTIMRESDDWRLRSAAIIASSKIEGDGALPEYDKLRTSSEWQIRRAVAQAMGNLSSDHARNTLGKMTSDSEPKVLAVVAQSLGNYPQIFALDDLQQLLRSDDVAVLTNASSALGQRGDRNAIFPLCDAMDRLRSPSDSEPMIEIMKALAAIVVGSEGPSRGELTDEMKVRAVETIGKALNDTDRTVAVAASRALASIDGGDYSGKISPESTVAHPLFLDEIRTVGSPRVRIVTKRGDIVVDLFPGEAPNTVANFLKLTGQGFYDGVVLHRVVPDFVTQGGCPRGDGWGSPGYQIRCEYNGLNYDTGMVGMALSGKDTGGSQFFITHSPQPHLDGRYTIFGKVVEGLSLISRILPGDTITRIELIPS